MERASGKLVAIKRFKDAHLDAQVMKLAMREVSSYIDPHAHFLSDTLLRLKYLYFACPGDIHSDSETVLSYNMT